MSPVGEISPENLEFPPIFSAGRFRARLFAEPGQYFVSVAKPAKYREN
jgi:hypothetical protein